MSITLANAKLYVGAILGGKNDTNIQSLAGDSIAATMEEWQRLHDWHFALQDTSLPYTVAACTSSGTGMTTATANGFRSILAGQTLTWDNDSSTVQSLTNDTTLVMATDPTNDATSETITVSGGIPLVAGTSTYRLRSVFLKPYSARLTSNSKIPLTFLRQRQYDRMTLDQSVTGTPTHYTIMPLPSETFDASDEQIWVIKVFPTPAASDILLLKFYRRLNPSLTTIDIHDDYLYAFLDCCRVHLLAMKDSNNPRLGYLVQKAKEGLVGAVNDDLQEGGEDEIPAFISQYEAIGAPDPEGRNIGVYV